MTLKWMLVWACLAAGALLPVAAEAGSVAKRVQQERRVRICVWPDYYGITYRNPKTDAWSGIDIELSTELGRDLKVATERVESSFAKLIDDLSNDRCDVAMFAVGVTAARQQHLRFSDPYMQSDIYGITTRSNRSVRGWGDIDKPGHLVGVQAGTFMEPVMRERLKQATMVVVAPPQTREQELEAGRIDVFMTDFPYSRRLLDSADWARLIAPEKPFFVLPYAYAVKPGDEVWLAQINDFVKRIKLDGRLRAAAQRAGLESIILSK